MAQPDIVLPINEFNDACTWLESHTLIDSFWGCNPPKHVLKDWVVKNWNPHEICLEGIQSLTKGFFLFHFSDPSHVDAIFAKGPWNIRASLLIFQHWSRDFSIFDDKKLNILVWVKFLGLPLPYWPFMQAIAQKLGRVICLEHDYFLNSHPHKRLCVEVDLSRELKESIEIQVGDTTFTQKVFYLNLPNTYYRCQSAEHKIKDCPLAVPRTKPPPKDASSQPVEARKEEDGKKDEWVTVGHRNKPHKQLVLAPISHPPPIDNMVSLQTPVIIVSNPVKQGKNVSTAQVFSPIASMPSTATKIVSFSSFHHSHSPSGHAKAKFNGMQDKWHHITLDFPRSSFAPGYLSNSFDSLGDEDGMDNTIIP